MKPFVRSHATQVAPLALKARTSLPLANRAGQRLACLDGQVWVTQQDDQRDVILKAGECFVLDRPGLALVFAFEDAVLALGTAAPKV